MWHYTEPMERPGQFDAHFSSHLVIHLKNCSRNSLVWSSDLLVSSLYLYSLSSYWWISTSAQLYNKCL